jgi:beta-glucuronidase
MALAMKKTFRSWALNHWRDNSRRALSVLLGASVMATFPLRAESPRPKAAGTSTALRTDSLTLAFPGVKGPIPYDSFGQFEEVGRPRYRYEITDWAGLARAAGEGIYPNKDVYKDPAYEKLQRQGRLNGNHWQFVDTPSAALNFYKWATAPEDPGVKQFYTAVMLERLGMIPEAINAYYAAAVHFPKATSTTFWKTPWYIGPTALDRVDWLTRSHPELNLHLEGGRIRVVHGFDEDPHNDVFETDPGRLRPGAPRLNRVRLSDFPIRQSIGRGRVMLQQYANGHWQLFVDGKPYVVRGISYSCTPVGRSPDEHNWLPHKDWMLSDLNKNGKIDGPFDAWVDKKRNNHQEADEPVVGDFELLRQMGVNTLRLYHHEYNTRLFKKLFKTYGIRVIMGDYLGAYAIGSGADWYTGTDYNDAGQREKMLASVREMVMKEKNQPYLLFWTLGNENNYSVANNAHQYPDVYYQFVNQAARLIKSLDPNHPVALCNGDLVYLDRIAQLCPDIDIFGANAYRGPDGFGSSFWQNLMDFWGKPALVSEFGCPAYDRHRSLSEGEAEQATYLKNQWLDIEYNLAGGAGVGNALGGIIFEWMDEWWKAGPPPQFDPAVHVKVGQFNGPFPDGWSYEEWYGIVSQGNGQNSPFERQLRKAYFVFKDELWNAREWAKRGLPEWNSKK